VSVAADDGGAEVEGLGGDQAQFLSKLVNTVGFCADEAVFASHKAEQSCQFEVA
jgi:hypothetical protein